MKVTLLEEGTSNNPVMSIAMAASRCYDSEPTKELVRNVLNSGHNSMAEFAAFHFNIKKGSRVFSHQLVRKRAGVSFCLSGDTRIYSDYQNGSVHPKTLKELYNTTINGLKHTNVRCVDEENKIITKNKPISIIKSGIKDVYTVKTKDGYSIKSTKEHKFLTDNGWKRLKNIKEGDIIYTNGEPLYMDKNWLEKKYHKENLSQKKIATLCNCSHHTIRKWIRKYNLQKELGSWSLGVEPPNKGKTKDNYKPMKISSEKLKGENNPNYKKGEKFVGEKNHQWKGNNIKNTGGYTRVQKHFDRKYKCEICDKETKFTEVHHIDKNPSNDSDDNLIELCRTCHAVQHYGVKVKQIRLSEIKSIEYSGKEMTYDLEMKNPHHNFIANGFVVHNSQRSQRYVNEDGFGYVTPDTIKKESFTHYEYDEMISKLHDLYNQFVEMGIPKEDARFILPNSTETEIDVMINLHSLMDLAKERLCTRAQWEIRDIVWQMRNQVVAKWPIFGEYIKPKCQVIGYCPEHKSCGLTIHKSEVRDLFKPGKKEA